MAVSNSIKNAWYKRASVDDDQWYGATSGATRTMKIQSAVVVGAGASSNITVTGINVGDAVVAVMHFAGAAFPTTYTERSGVTTITAANTIQLSVASNTSAGDRLWVIWAASN